MSRGGRLLAGCTLAAAALAIGAGSATAGQPKVNPLTFVPNPVPAGSSTTASGVCPTSATFVIVTFDLVLTGGGEQQVSAKINVDPDTRAFSGAIAIDPGAVVQTNVPASGTCYATVGGTAVGFLSGQVSIAPQVTTTAATTTTTTTTTVAATTTAAPVVTTAPVASSASPVTNAPLPRTGTSSGTGPTAAIGASALALGIGLVLLTRRRSADA